MPVTHRMKLRLLLAVVVGTILGLILGLLIDRVYNSVNSTPAPRQLENPPLRLASSVVEEWSRVGSPTEAVSKFRAGKLGRAPVTLRYPAAAKTKILSALRKTYLRQHPGGVFQAAAWWGNFVAHDTCAAHWSPSGTTGADYWSCRDPMPSGATWTKLEVRGYICSGVAGIAAMSSHGVALFGVFAGWAACVWGPVLESKAH